MVIRTGWDDWQRFLVKETEDPLKFPACLEGWRSKGTPDLKFLWSVKFMSFIKVPSTEIQQYFSHQIGKT